MTHSALRASIDLGTNTCLLLISEVDLRKKVVLKTLREQVTLVRLGEGVAQTLEFQSRAMERTLSCLKQYVECLLSYGIPPGDVICAATSQAREVLQPNLFFNQIFEETGLSFKILSGQEEAQATFLGTLLPGMNPKNTWVIDIGGGSTEMIAFNQSKSLDLGAVRLTERFFSSPSAYSRTGHETPVAIQECQRAIQKALHHLAEFKTALKPKTVSLVAVAGTATALAAWSLGLPFFDSTRINGTVLTLSELSLKVEELKRILPHERKKLPCMEPLRADVLLAGAMILKNTLDYLGFLECRVSSRGLRYGLLFKNELLGE